ncbi:hypothetical protein RND81_01G177000 [Saponaria officinalis]|uniref:RING-type E3 ubiquitin transferase n=1 Tax=Saponaria officinalis TaxID=3572 RepID=A0AAW1NGF9_SAPOF
MYDTSYNNSFQLIHRKSIFLLLVTNSPVFVMADGKPKSSWNNLYIIFIYVGFFAIAVIVSRVVRRYRNRRLEGGNQLPVRRSRGMDAEEIESLPSLRFSEIKLHKVAEEGQVECSVCLNEFKDQEMLRLLPDCLHVFHPDCIGPWLRAHVTCPVCRASLTLDQRQGSSVSTSSILERISGILSTDTYDHRNNGADDHDDGDGDDRGDSESMVEIEESFDLENGHVDLGGARGERPLVRRYSTGDLAVVFVGENSRTNIEKGEINENSPKLVQLSNISSKSDSFVDYNSLLSMEVKGNST